MAARPKPRWPGDPTSLMVRKMELLLRRLRLQYPFPHDQMEVLQSLYPEGYLDDIADYRFQNARSCWTWDHRVQVSLDAREDRTFWMRFDDRVPAPTHDVCLTMPDENPYYLPVLEWLASASLLAERVTYYGTQIQSYLEWAESVKMVTLDWNELADFVAYPENRAHSKKSSVKKPGNKPIIPQQDKDAIMELLATATLLEDRTCNAWVGWSDE